MKADLETSKDSENRTVTGQWNHCPVVRPAKTHQDFWKVRVKRRSFRDPSGEMVTPPEFSVRMFHLGQEGWFNLDTANQTAAAVKARDIYLLLISAGWDATLAKFKPAIEQRSEVCTLGEFLADVCARSHLKPITIRRYAVKLRKMVADLSKVDAGLRGKAKRSKYDYVNGGRKAWLAKVDGRCLDVLTQESITSWRNAYVAKAGNDPVRRKSAERSAASYLRCARSLFTRDILSVLKVKLPVNPFDGVKLKDPGAQRYLSDISAEWLLNCAESELRTVRPQEFLALFLCLWAGLRRKEADLLMWDQIDFGKGQIFVRRTAYFDPKTEESQRLIDLPPEAVDVLRGYRRDNKSEFVLDGSQPNPSATYDYYRCDCTWRNLHSWLREKGVRQAKAIHALRKESGSLIASHFGIEAARQHLGHRDIRTTSSHYVEKKKRIEIQLPLRVPNPVRAP